MDRPDRLSALVARFEIHATLADRGSANLLVLGETETAEPCAILFQPLGAEGCDSDVRTVLAGARVGLGGAANPIANPVTMALPQRIEIALAEAPEAAAVAALLVEEARERRCGGAAAFNRLAEVLIILLLRRAIEEGAAGPGLLAGLADPKLSRALVAIHEAPGRAWSAADLAAIAGMSRSQFMAAFRRTLGETPITYLTAWRMQAAEAELERGARVAAVARQSGYASAEAFSRAFARWSGRTPTSLTRRPAGMAAR